MLREKLEALKMEHYKKALNFSDREIDRSKLRITVRVLEDIIAKLDEGKSEETIKWYIKLKIIDLKSELCHPEAFHYTRYELEAYELILQL